MKKILSLLLVSSALFSCSDDDINPEQNFATGPKIVGFVDKLSTVSYFVDEGPVSMTFPVSLIGFGNGQTNNSDIVVNYTVDPSSTATEGVEFNFANTSGSVTIPAGGTFGNFPLIVNTGQLNPTQATRLVLNLSSASGAVVGEQYKQLNIVFVGCQSPLEGNFNVFVTRSATSVTWNFTNEIVTETSVNNFKTTRTGQYTLTQLTAASSAGYDFIDICGEITVPEQQLGGVYSNKVRPIESNNGLDGTASGPNNFQTKYEIGFTSNTIWYQYVSTYTRSN